MSPDAVALMAGAAAFPLCLIYDVFNMKRRRGGVCFFALGALLLAGSTGYVLARRLPDGLALAPVLCTVAALGALASFAGLIAALFVAIPPASYVSDGEKAVVASGLYALCRHPGVLFLCAFYFFAALMLRSRAGWAMLALYTALDTAYVAVQDKYIFPRVIAGYGEYKRTTPFLLPTAASLRAMKGNKR